MQLATRALTDITNSTLLTVSVMSPHTPLPAHYIALCLVHILMTLWTCLSNATTVITILMDAKLRAVPKNLLIVNSAVSELMVGLFICPLYTDSMLHGTWRTSREACITYELMFYVQVCVSTLAVLIINVERFYYLLAPRMMDGSGKGVMTSVLVILPWITGVSLVVPMYTEGIALDIHPTTPEGHCVILWKWKFQVVTSFASFFAPSFLVISMMTAVVIAYVVFGIVAKGGNRDADTDEKPCRESFHTVVLASTVSVGLVFPVFICLLLYLFCDPAKGQECIRSHTAWGVTMSLAMIKPGLLPLVWLVSSDIRHAFISMWKRRRRLHRYPWMHSDNLTPSMASASTGLTQF